MNNRELFLRYQAQTSDFPLLLEVASAEGCYLYDPNGKKYLDLISGISVSNVGHRHPEVVNAIKEQVDKYMHLLVYGEFIQSPQAKLAEKLCSLLPPSLDNVYFTNSGSEAVEGALKLAKRVTRKSEILSYQSSYHGSTLGALSIMGNEEYKSAFTPLLPGTRLIRYNNFEDIETISNLTAAVILETIQAEAGIILPKEGYLEAIRKKCNETGTLLIFDEVQTGFGRTGKMFGFEHTGVIPDIITFAKGMGGGMPIGAFVASQQLMHTFKNNPILGHITTFGGHPVCCAAALANIEVIDNNKLHQQAEAKGLLFESLLKHKAIKDIRRKGLMMAIEFESFKFNKAVIDECMTNGVITDWFLFNDNSMRIAPPLIISEEEIREACGVILEAIERTR